MRTGKMRRREAACSLLFPEGYATIRGDDLQEGVRMYRELLGKLIEGHKWAKLQEPCLEEELEQAERAVGLPSRRKRKRCCAK